MVKKNRYLLGFVNFYIDFCYKYLKKKFKVSAKSYNNTFCQGKRNSIKKISQGFYQV